MSNEYTPKKPPGLMIWKEDQELLINLPDEQAGRILKAVINFRLTNEAEEMENHLEQSFLDQLIKKAARDEQTYQATNKQRSDKQKENQKNKKKST